MPLIWCAVEKNRTATAVSLTAPWPHGVVTTLPTRSSPTPPSVPIANARRRPVRLVNRKSACSR